MALKARYNSSRGVWIAWGMAVFSACAWCGPAFADSRSDVEAFEQNIRPLLAAKCVSCHSAANPSGGLRLDNAASVRKGGNRGAAVTPGQPNESLLIRAVSYQDKKLQMPPAGRLPDRDVAALREWIQRGAPWPVSNAPNAGRPAGDWWAFRPIKQPVVPSVKDNNWSKTPIDRFVWKQLEAKGMRPSPAADKRTLIRRVTYDLTGLPPTPDEIDRFLNDHRPNAYNVLVDRLLASPRYGERWGRHWLDVAHYGDTHGYDKDKRRDNAWPYRDYVIRAFNEDKPYAQFIREQIAGDVLYPDSRDGIVATGFVAAGPWDFVGQLELGENTVEKLKTRVLDRDDMVATTISTFNSVTIHCARCHDHKFDPITQRDYYGLQAVFAGVDRADRPYSDPLTLAQRRALLGRKTAALQQVAAAERAAASLTSPELNAIDAERTSIRSRLAMLKPPAASPGSPSNGYHSSISTTQDSVRWVQIDLGKPVAMEAIRLIPARPTDFPDTPGFGFPLRYKVSISDRADFSVETCVSDQTAQDTANPGDLPVIVRVKGRTGRYVRVTAYRLWPRTNDYIFALAEIQVDSARRNEAIGAVVTALDSIEAGRWSVRYLTDSYDSRSRLPDTSNPAIAEQVRLQTELLDRADALDVKRRALCDSLLDSGTKQTRDQAQKDLAEIDVALQKLPPAQQVYALVSHAPRTVSILQRGEVEKPLQPAVPGALSCLKSLPSEFAVAADANEGTRRAALANWIADANNPLTWRSIVNRIWGYHFGRGIVDTPNDFGRNGSLPTHPELLDWLATYFVAHGQSMKSLHRLILTSAVYRQSSQSRDDYARIDGDNHLLWRMNRQRLDAEAIRDSLLAVTGKLDVTMGGPGFDLFRFKDDHSPVYDYNAPEKILALAAMRRTIYAFQVRSVPNPFLETLDAPDPNINTPVRNATLTPLQALALMNDPFVVKMSEAFAARLTHEEADRSKAIDRAFLWALGRMPAAAERNEIAGYAAKHGFANACRMLLNTNEFIFVD